MAWQLANEPRPLSNVDAYLRWIEGAVGLIRRIDCHHMVNLGSEGDTPWPSYVHTDLARDHRLMDYVGVHVGHRQLRTHAPSTHQTGAPSHALAQHTPSR